MRALLALIILGLAGCAAPGGGPAPAPEPLEAATFTAPAVIDPVRSGGEPVIFFTPQGTLLIAAHPGYTHVKAPPGPEVLTPTSGQSYLFRSTDNGATWSVVTSERGAGPQSTAVGVSDPDLASNEDGSLLVMCDLEALLGVSTSASTDDGASFPAGQPAAANAPDGSVDRPWLSYLNGTFYLLYNGDGNGHWRLRASTDGLAWSDFSTPGDGSYPGALIADPRANALYVGNGDKVWWSTDAGATFTASKMPTDRALTGIVAQRPAVDDAGTVYFAWSELDGIWYAASHDHGATWDAPVLVSAPGTHIWPWPVAGAAGRLAIVWLGTNDAIADPGSDASTWTVHVAMIADADTSAPRVSSQSIENAVATQGTICLDGTICEAQGKDRRLGDFITAAIAPDGLLHVAYGTTETGHSISSPAYFRQESGLRLR